MKKTPPPDKSVEEAFEPDRPTLWASLVFAIATLTLAWPALTGQILFNSRSDQYTLGYAFRHFAEESFRAGQGIPQWSPYLQGGLPYISAMHGDIFYPTFLLRLAIGTAEGITWSFIIHLFLCGLFTFMFLRAWRLPFVAAVIGGLAYMLSGSIAGYASPGHDGKLYVSTLLPLTVFLLTRGIRDGRAWAWGTFALVIGLAVLTPHPQLLQYMLLASGAFALYLAFATHEGVGKLPTAVAIRRLGYAAGGVVLGLLIGAIQFIPSFSYAPWSPRAGGHDWETATSFSFPIEETLNAYLPQFSGILGQYWGQNGIHFHSDYFGVVVLMLMGAAFGAGLHKSFKRFWLATALVALVWAWGGNTPLYHLIMLVPYTKYLRAPSTMIYVTAFAVAVLAAIGTERVMRGWVSRKYAPAWAIAGGLFALFISIGGYGILVDMATGLIALSYPPEVRSQVGPAFASRADANASSAVLGAWRSFFFVAVTAGLMWGYLGRRIPLRAAAIGLVAVVVIDLWSIERLYWQWMPPASRTFASDPAIDSIKADIARSGEPGRTILLPMGQGLDPYDTYFRKRALMNHLVRTVEGEQGNELDIYRRMTQLDSGQVTFRPTFWRHENVRYVYTGVDEATMAQIGAQLGAPPFTKLAGPVRNANGSMVFAYRVGMPNPYAWVAGGAVKAQPEQVLPTILDPRFNPALAAIVDTGQSIPATDPGQLVPSAASARVTSYAPGKVSVELTQPATEGSVLVVSENYYPGWTATSGSVDLPLSRANYNLIGVSLPAGTRQVELSFADAAYARGRIVTFVALAVAALLLMAGIVMNRRARVEPVASTA
ncbi:MAG TPA: hypothetical protein VFO55_04840 [Gemmatimonadaceae bacterium]|nr:hypothetical protein [Gemmatimonadaceae bacterium]